MLSKEVIDDAVAPAETGGIDGLSAPLVPPIAENLRLLRQHVRSVDIGDLHALKRLSIIKCAIRGSIEVVLGVLRPEADLRAAITGALRPLMTDVMEAIADRSSEFAANVSAAPIVADLLDDLEKLAATFLPPSFKLSLLELHPRIVALFPEGVW